jgi:hypothetical protein
MRAGGSCVISSYHLARLRSETATFSNGAHDALRRCFLRSDRILLTCNGGGVNGRRIAFQLRG